MTFLRGRVSARLESSLGRHPGSAVGLESRGRRAALSDTHRPRRFLRPWGALADARRSALLADAVSPPKIDAKATCNPWNDSRSSGLTSATAARSATRPSRSNSRPEADRPTAVFAAATFSPAPLPWAMPNSDVYRKWLPLSYRNSRNWFGGRFSGRFGIPAAYRSGDWTPRAAGPL